jgi:hypothetical protein
MRWAIAATVVRVLCVAGAYWGVASVRPIRSACDGAAATVCPIERGVPVGGLLGDALVASAIKHVHEIAAGPWDRARLAPPAQPAIIIGSPP